MKINYDLPFESKVEIKIYDMTGREVANLLDVIQSAGFYTLTFNASAFASGVYFYRINAKAGGVNKTQSFSKAMRMVLVK